MQATDGGIQHSTNHQNDAGDHQSLEQSNVICVCFLTRLLQVFFVPLDPHELTLTVKPNEPLFAALCHSTQDTSEYYTHHICKSDHRHERSHKCRCRSEERRVGKEIEDGQQTSDRSLDK